MPPFLGGGEMIREVRFEGTTFNDPPHKFEAGTPNIAGVIGLGAAVDYLRRARHGRHRGARTGSCSPTPPRRCDRIDGLRIFGTRREKAAVISFLVEGAHAHDLATLLDLEGVAVRSGHHCAHPLMACLRRAGHLPRLAGFLQHASTRSTRSSRRWQKVRRGLLG